MFDQSVDASRSLSTTDDDLTATQFEEAIASVEDDSDRQAADELINEIINNAHEFNEEETNEEQITGKQHQRQMDEVEEELQTLDDQV